MRKISAVIPLYKSDFYIKGAVESVLNQDMDDIELILVSDGSPGREREILSEYEGKFKYIEIPHGGIANAWNVGFRAAQGKYFTWFGADDRHFPNSFRLMSEYLDKNKDVGMVYSDVVLVSGETNTHITGSLSKWQKIFTQLEILINQIIERFKGKRLVIYGAGSVARYLYSHIGSKLDIKSFVDQDDKLHFTKFEDKIDILPIEYLQKLEFDNILVTPLNRKYALENFLLNFIGERDVGKAVFIDDLLKIGSPEINMEEPIKLIEFQDLFRKIDEMTFKHDTTKISCRVWRKGEFTKEEILRKNIMTTIFMYRREVRDVIGEYDTSFEIVMDFDYWHRISEKFEIRYIQDVLGLVNIGDKCFHKLRWETGTKELYKLMPKTLKRRGIKRSWFLKGHEYHFE